MATTVVLTLAVQIALAIVLVVKYPRRVSSVCRTLARFADATAAARPTKKRKHIIASARRRRPVTAAAVPFEADLISALRNAGAKPNEATARVAQYLATNQPATFEAALRGVFKAATIN